jgi:hypothetical protein
MKKMSGKIFSLQTVVPQRFIILLLLVLGTLVACRGQPTSEKPSFELEATPGLAVVEVTHSTPGWSVARIFQEASAAVTHSTRNLSQTTIDLLIWGVTLIVPYFVPLLVFFWPGRKA